MYNLNVPQQNFNNMPLSSVVRSDMINSIKGDNPLDFSDDEIMGLLNLAWKYKKSPKDVLKDCFLEDFNTLLNYQRNSRKNK